MAAGSGRELWPRSNVKSVVGVAVEGAGEGGSPEPGGDGPLGGAAALDVLELPASDGEDGDGMAVRNQRWASAGELLRDEVPNGMGEGLGRLLKVRDAVSLIVQANHGGRKDDSAGGCGGEGRDVHGRGIGTADEKLSGGPESYSKTDALKFMEDECARPVARTRVGFEEGSGGFRDEFFP